MNVWGLEHFGAFTSLGRTKDMSDEQSSLWFADLKREHLAEYILCRRRQTGTGSETCEQAFCLWIFISKRAAWPNAVCRNSSRSVVQAHADALGLLFFPPAYEHYFDHPQPP